MSNLFNYLKKAFPKKSSEKKTKEEEDINQDINLNIQVNKSGLYDKLEFLVSGINIRNEKVENFGDYQQKITTIISEYRKEETELNFRYKIKLNEEEKMNEDSVTDIDKMKLVGKIGTEPTILDVNSSSQNIHFSSNRMKLLGKENFPSIRANNAIFKNKFCYECVLYSKRLIQLGFSTLLTPFTHSNGVGDDPTSFAIDGYRKCKWNKDQITYGESWDIGDVIGVCIDMESKVIEFFRNGKSLGIAFNNIPAGENIAYFPAVSMSMNEEISFNFGKLPMRYKYEGYETIDIPDYKFTKLDEITKDLLDLLENHVLKILRLQEINDFSKIMISYQIFDFLYNYSLRDVYILKEILFPFLSKLEFNHLEIFLTFLFKMIYNNERIETVICLFDVLTNLIEEYSISGFEFFSRFNSHYKLLQDLLRIEEISILWIEGRKYNENLKTVFNSNIPKFNEMIKILKDKAKNQEEKNILKILEQFKSDSEIIDKSKYMNEIAITHQEFILFLLKSDKSFKIKNRTISLQGILFEFFDNAIENIKSNHNIIGNILFNPQRDTIHTLANEKILKNAILPLFNIFRGFINLDLQKFSLEEWFIRLNNNSLYYDEIGIGGTISHVSTEHASKLKKDLIPKNEEFQSMLFHRLIKIFQFISPFLKTITKAIDRKKNFFGNSFKELSDEFDQIFKTYLTIFTDINIENIYCFSYFLVNLLNKSIDQNKYLVYFIPYSITDIPFEFYKFLKISKFTIFKNPEIRSKLNSISPHFSGDDFSYQIIKFYTLLFSDSTIANPELKEVFLSRIKFFLSRKKCLKIYESNSDLISLLIKGILHYMSLDAYAVVACDIMVKIIQPWNFGEKNENKVKNNVLIDNIINYFKSHEDAFTNFMDPYNKYLNLVMTEFSNNLRDVGKPILHVGPAEEGEIRTNYLRKYKNSFSSLCSLMKILEFLLFAYSKPFLDTSSINFSYFSSFMKNFSNRIFDKNYLNQIINIFEKHQTVFNEEIKINNLFYPTVGIFLNINQSKTEDNFPNFISKIANLSDFDLGPFYDIYEILKKDPKNEHLTTDFEHFHEILDSISAKIRKKSKLSMDEIESATKGDELCILCYSNIKDKVLIPCKHVCCNDCLIRYLHLKKTCFICNAAIETVEDLDLNLK